MGQLSGIEIFSPPKISPREEKLASQGLRVFHFFVGMIDHMISFSTFLG